MPLSALWLRSKCNICSYQYDFPHDLKCQVKHDENILPEQQSQPSKTESANAKREEMMPTAEC